MKASSLDGFILLAGQNDRVELGAGRLVSATLTISTEAEKMAAYDVFDIPLNHTFLCGVVDEPAGWFVHWFVGVAADKDIDTLEAVYGAIVDIVSGLMLYPEHVAGLLPGSAYMPDADVHEGALASVPFFNTKSQRDVVQGEAVRVLTRTIEFVISIHDAEDFFLVLFQVLNPPSLLLRGGERLGINIRLGGAGCVLALITGEYNILVGLFQQLLEGRPLLLIKLRGAGVDVSSDEDLDPLQLLREVDDYGHS